MLYLSIPGLAAVLLYIYVQYHDIPSWLGYMFWPMLLTGVALAPYVILRCRKEYKGVRRPWPVSLAIAINVILCFVGLFFVAFAAVGFVITRN